MKSTSVKTMVAKVMTVGLLAGAFVLAAPQKAQAQVSVGVQFGYPQYGYDRDYYDHLRYEQARREAFLRQQEWERQQAFMRHEAWERYGDRGRDWHHDHDDHRDWEHDRH
jgi:hypothetical protein